VKVTEATFTVLDDWFRRGLILEQIEGCGGVCRRRGDRTETGSAASFIRDAMTRGEESLLEMAPLATEIHVDSESTMHKFFETIPASFRAHAIERKRYLLSGNPRAFRDLARSHGNLKVVKALLKTLAEAQPVLFLDQVPRHGLVPQDGIAVRIMAPDEIERLPLNQFVWHRTLLVHLVVSRAVCRELMKHRVASHLLEREHHLGQGGADSARELVFIRPRFLPEDPDAYRIWEDAVTACERNYLRLLGTASPEAAPTILPDSLKIELMVHCTLAEWARIAGIEVSPGADPSVREIMLGLLSDFMSRFPQVFGPVADLAREKCEVRRKENLWNSGPIS